MSSLCSLHCPGSCSRLHEHVCSSPGCPCPGIGLPCSWNVGQLHRRCVQRSSPAIPCNAGRLRPNRGVPVAIFPDDVFNTRDRHPPHRIRVQCIGRGVLVECQLWPVPYLEFSGLFSTPPGDPGGESRGKTVLDIYRSPCIRHRAGRHHGDCTRPSHPYRTCIRFTHP